MARKKGILSKIFSLDGSKARSKAATSRNGGGTGNGWRYRSGIGDVKSVTFPAVPVHEVPAGEWELNVLVYDGRPLKGTRKGSKLLLDVVPGTHTMTSVYTGTVWTSDCTLAYRGQLIGHPSDGRCKDHLTKLAMDYGHVVVHAVRLGTDPGGWPIIKLMLPRGF